MPDVVETCQFHSDHDPITEAPRGDACGAVATHLIVWSDGSRASYACENHLELDEDATVKPARILPLKRFFDVEFGITYVICARSMRGVIEVLKSADADFLENLRELGGMSIKEISPEDAATRTFDDDGTKKPIASMTPGDWASSEY